MENTEIVKILKTKGRISIKEGNSKIMEWILSHQWQQESDTLSGIFLFYELFQIRAVAEQFSEVSLDIVEYATKATIYHCPASRLLKKGPVLENKVKFSLIRHPYWNKLLYSIGQPVIMQIAKEGPIDLETKERFPLFGPETKEMFLSPDGDVKIIKG